MFSFTETIDIIGVNPFVTPPEPVLNALFLQAGKDKGAIPIKGLINGRHFTQTIIRYRGQWRLYINTTMLKNSPKHVGEVVELEICFDNADRSFPMPPKFAHALTVHPIAKQKFDSLTPSRQKEIVRYLGFLKSEEALSRNIARAIAFLEGKERFVGRDKP